MQSNMQPIHRPKPAQGAMRTPKMCALSVLCHDNSSDRALTEHKHVADLMFQTISIGNTGSQRPENFILEELTMPFQACMFDCMFGQAAHGM